MITAMQTKTSKEGLQNIRTGTVKKMETKKHSRSEKDNQELEEKIKQESRSRKVRYSDHGNRVIAVAWMDKLNL